MIDIKKEKSRKLETQDVYDIVSMAADAANDNGFLNSFVYERSVYELAAILLVDGAKKYNTEFAKNPLKAWDKMLADGTIDSLLEEDADDIAYLGDVANVWYDEYNDYLGSIRSVVDDFQAISGQMSQDAMDNIRELSSDEVAAEVQEIADKWGLNNVSVATDDKKKSGLKLVKNDDKDSLFKD